MKLISKAGQIKIAILGCTGKTGSKILKHALFDKKIDIVGGLVSPESLFLGVDLGEIVSYDEKIGVAAKSNLFEVISDADIVIDFSTKEVTSQLLDILGNKKLIVGVTGLDEELKKKIHKLGGANVIFKSANMSFGVGMISQFLKTYATIINDDYEVIINDIHHAGKKDAPSGTALTLKHALGNDNIQIHSSRIADVKGIHEIVMINNCETISIKHDVNDRSIFAINALKIAHWVNNIDKNGVYRMDDFINYFV